MQIGVHPPAREQDARAGGDKDETQHDRAENAVVQDAVLAVARIAKLVKIAMNTKRLSTDSDCSSR